VGSSLPAGNIVIGSIEPLSGIYGPVGQSFKVLIDAAAAYLNAHGGIAGHDVTVQHFNDNSDPTTALAGARQLTDAHVAGIIGFGFGPSKDDTLPYFMKSQLPVINTNANQFLFNVGNEPYFFGVGPSDQQIAQGWVDFAKKKGYTKLGGLSDGEQFGDELAAFSQQDAAKAGLTWTKTVSYSPTAVDITTQLRQLQGTGAQAIVTGALTNIPRIFSGLAQIGWSPPIITTGVVALYPPAALGKLDASTYAYCTDYLNPGEAVPSSMAPLLAKGQAALGAGANPLNVLAFEDILNLYKAAILQAKSLNGPAIKAALEKLTNVQSVDPLTHYSFSATDHAGYQEKVHVCGVAKTGPYGLLYLAS
jgi:branched-chain amino acid transport system substrate-binding protein